MKCRKDRLHQNNKTTQHGGGEKKKLVVLIRSPTNKWPEDRPEGENKCLYTVSVFRGDRHLCRIVAVEVLATRDQG